jgi:hypothetical protein
MKFLLLVFLFLTSYAQAQRYVLPEGEFMDTTFTQNPKCSGYYPYYYSTRTKYPKSSTTLLSEVKDFLKIKGSVYQGSGYVTFRFAVDCEGIVLGGIRVMQTDANYKVFHFDKEFVEELYAFFRTMTLWEIGKLDSGEPVNYIAYVTFKIKDGKVTHIIP